jgi:mannose-1-phosphate guanylyltransferase
MPTCMSWVVLDLRMCSDLTGASGGVPVSRHNWAVLLAGGDGARLQSLRLKIEGDSRPKRFCSTFGGESLLTQTRARVGSLIYVDRELFVVTRAHET